MNCKNCPRKCICDRDGKKLGFCSMPNDIYVAKYMLHNFEEPCISHKGGAGTIFFSGCNLKCVFCQNKQISRNACGEAVDHLRLLRIMHTLKDGGAECIELVTPTHYTSQLIPILKAAREEISLPFVWNCGGYEDIEMLRALDGLIDVYMPDLKYYSSELSLKYSSAPDYFDKAITAVCEMVRQTGKPKFDDNGKLLRGTVVRHLVLPACREDSVKLLSKLSEVISPEDVILSLMSQYTPEFYDISCGNHKNLTRRVTSFEYNSVLKKATELGFDGYFQNRDSASAKYTPNFNE